MFKHILWLLIGSVAAIFFKNQLGEVLQFLLLAHNKLASWLSFVFARDSAGQLIQDILALMIIPMLAGLVATFVFWLFKHVAMPHTILAVWVFWVILVVTMLAQVAG